MFTGIVEEVGTIKKINNLSLRSMQLTIKAKKILSDIRIGDSIAVNGVCLTVTSFNESNFQLDVMPETIRATSLCHLKAGSPVNLERSLRVDGRIGGHFVTGHVDDIGKIIYKETCENASCYGIKIPKTLLSYFIMKGSVAIDGVSLTIFGIDKERSVLTISLIPHTLQATNLGNKEVGDIVNIECDILAKHVYSYIEKVKMN